MLKWKRLHGTVCGFLFKILQIDGSNDFFEDGLYQRSFVDSECDQYTRFYKHNVNKHNMNLRKEFLAFESN